MAAMRMEDVRRRLARLPDPLPRPPAVLRPVVVSDPQGRSGVERPRSPATDDSAVLVLLFPDTSGEARLVLTERPTGDLRHAGEVSLPGGRQERDDGGPEATALREAREEVGLDPEQAGLSLLGRLDPFEISVSGFRLTPVLAVAERAPALRPDPREVAAVLLPPVDRFLPGARIEMHELERGGWRIRFGAYPVDGRAVWGATAHILGQLGAVLAAPEEPVRLPTW